MDTALHSPIFVVGVGRSGTTLLSALLSNHARIAITPETHFLRRADLRGPLDGGPPDFDAFWDEYTQWCRFRAANARSSLASRRRPHPDGFRRPIRIELEQLAV